MFLRILSLLVAVSLFGCPKILIKPPANSVKKIAIISVYMNRNIYDVTKPPKKSLIGAALGALADDRQKATTELVSNGLYAYEQNLAGAGWEVIPNSKVLSAESLKAFQVSAITDNVSGAKGKALKGLTKLAQGEWEAPVGMPIIPIENLFDLQQKVKGSDPSREALQKNIAAVCAELGADAVAVIQIDAAYELTKGVKVSGPLRETQPAIPSVSAAMAVVTKDGKLAAKTEPITPGAGDRFTGEKSRMIVNGQVALERRDDKGLASYSETINLAANNLAQKIAKENRAPAPSKPSVNSDGLPTDTSNSSPQQNKQRTRNSKTPVKLDYDKMGLETKDRGTFGNPAVGAPDSERLGHEKIESLQAEAMKARAEGTKAVEGLTPASQPTSQPKKP